MIIYYSSKFEKEYKRLPQSIKKIAEKKEQLFRKNPHNPILKTHQLVGRLKTYWSFSINYQYRIIFEFIKKEEVWFYSVGTHQIYKYLNSFSVQTIAISYFANYGTFPKPLKSFVVVN